jgi:hypothetical protein
MEFRSSLNVASNDAPTAGGGVSELYRWPIGPWDLLPPALLGCAPAPLGPV